MSSTSSLHRFSHSRSCRALARAFLDNEPFEVVCPTEADSPFDVFISVKAAGVTLVGSRQFLACAATSPSGKREQLECVLGQQGTTNSRKATARYVPMEKGTHQVRVSFSVPGKRETARTIEVAVGKKSVWLIPKSTLEAQPGVSGQLSQISPALPLVKKGCRQHSGNFLSKRSRYSVGLPFFFFF